jgi:hypothetical protein
MVRHPFTGRNVPDDPSGGVGWNLADEPLVTAAAGHWSGRVAMVYQ